MTTDSCRGDIRRLSNEAPPGFSVIACSGSSSFCEGTFRFRKSYPQEGPKVPLASVTPKAEVTLPTTVPPPTSSTPVGPALPNSVDPLLSVTPHIPPTPGSASSLLPVPGVRFPASAAPSPPASALSPSAVAPPHPSAGLPHDSSRRGARRPPSPCPGSDRPGPSRRLPEPHLRRSRVHTGPLPLLPACHSRDTSHKRSPTTPPCNRGTPDKYHCLPTPTPPMPTPPPRPAPLPPPRVPPTSHPPSMPPKQNPRDPSKCYPPHPVPCVLCCDPSSTGTSP
uniref:uncharacterized protein LOC129133611 n=1 Tax=Agelaius phoeniceus TaxID=39638 RepID=UPI0023EA88A6|nr:uncharacterized protein LOC129133611 [Agelaius phoeniceus]